MHRVFLLVFLLSGVTPRPDMPQNKPADEPDEPEYIFEPFPPLTKVELWRAQQLEAAGYNPEDATLIALDHTVDLHQAIELKQAGCDDTTALQILL